MQINKVTQGKGSKARHFPDGNVETMYWMLDGEKLRKSYHKTVTMHKKKLGRAFVYLSGPKSTLALEGKRCTMSTRNEYTRFTYLKFSRKKDDTVEALKYFLAETRTDGDV